MAPHPQMMKLPTKDLNELDKKVTTMYVAKIEVNSTKCRNTYKKVSQDIFVSHSKPMLLERRINYES